MKRLNQFIIVYMYVDNHVVPYNNIVHGDCVEEIQITTI